MLVIVVVIVFHSTFLLFHRKNCVQANYVIFFLSVENVDGVHSSGRGGLVGPSAISDPLS